MLLSPARQLKINDAGEKDERHKQRERDTQADNGVGHGDTLPLVVLRVRAVTVT
jgi:hypothetical protein